MLPIVLTKKQKVLIVGAGRACAIKLKVLTKANYDISIVSDEFSYDLDTLPYKKIQKDFYDLKLDFFEEFDLIYIAIALKNDFMVKKLLKNKLVNVLSNPTLSNFVHPCSRDDGDIMVSVSNLKEKNPRRACKLAEKFLEFKNKCNFQ